MAQEYNIIGKRGIRRKDGYEKASGRGIYTRDRYLPGMLYAKHFTSPYAHAKIKSMDTSKAEALPGVRAIIRYDDPEIEEPIFHCRQGWFGGGISTTGWGWIEMLPGVARWYGEPMGFAVCADTEQLCDDALKLVEIEWEELPFIIDPEEALEPGAPLLRPDINPDNNIFDESVTDIGDIDTGFAEANKVIEFQARQEEDVWAGVEALSALAVWKGDYLEVWVHVQNDFAVHLSLSQFMPMSKATVRTSYGGAQFGGLAWLAVDEVFPRYAIIFAKRTQRPVKALYDGSHFYGSGWTVGSYNFKVGFKNDGTITAVKVDTVLPNADVQKFVRAETTIPNIYGKQIHPYVNRGPRVCYKHGAIGAMIKTLIFDHVAGELGMDPTELALKNDGCEGTAMADLAEYKLEHWLVDRDSLREVLEAGKAAIDWDNKRHSPGTRKLPNGNMHGIGFTWGHQYDGECHRTWVGVMIRMDGTASILQRHSDIGVNPETAYTQIVAEELGMRYEDIDFRPFEDVGFQGSPPSGSSGLPSSSWSMREVGRRAKQKLLEMATDTVQGREGPFPGLKPEDLDVKDSMVFEKANSENKKTVKEVVGVHWGTTMWGHVHAPVFEWVWYGPEKGEHDVCRWAHFIEVEVDTETGGVEITKVVNVNDVGQAISPEACEGQQYGGSYMGIGRSKTEAVFFDPQTGVKLNDNLIGYPFLTMNDIGSTESILVETGMGWAAYGTTGMSEVGNASTATLTGPAIYNAIGIWVDDFPTTPNKILKALGKA